MIEPIELTCSFQSLKTVSGLFHDCFSKLSYRGKTIYSVKVEVN